MKVANQTFPTINGFRASQSQQAVKRSKPLIGPDGEIPQEFVTWREGCQGIVQPGLIAVALIGDSLTNSRNWRCIFICLGLEAEYFKGIPTADPFRFTKPITARLVRVFRSKGNWKGGNALLDPMIPQFSQLLLRSAQRVFAHCLSKRIRSLVIVAQSAFPRGSQVERGSTWDARLSAGLPIPNESGWEQIENNQGR
jgi:hypothetical protein